MSWGSVKEFLRGTIPLDYTKLGLDHGECLDYMLCPYNANTFPKDHRWRDEAGRYWVMEGDPGVWNLKLARSGEFPELDKKILLTFTLKHQRVLLPCRVTSITMQTADVLGVTKSTVCAKAMLSIVGPVTLL